MTVDTQAFKDALARWASGVTIVTTTDADGNPKGMTASSFTSVSLNPPLILVCLAQKLYTHQLMQDSSFFAVNIIGTRNLEWAQLFAGMMPEIEDRFAHTGYTTGQTGAPILSNVIGWVECKTYATQTAGDHTIFVGEVIAAGNKQDDNPLLYYARQWGTFDALE
jgi:flavin reductase (DIM6/NTAB) family NADH-FMN oxidoreductase RutF